MDISNVIIDCLWTAVFAAGTGLLLTAPVRNIFSIFLCGFISLFSRDVLMYWGLNLNWSTVIASAIVVFIAVSLVKGHKVSPVILISGVLPLGATIAVFKMITELMRVSSLTGDAQNSSVSAIVTNFSIIFTTSLAIAVGLAAGIVITRLISKVKSPDDVNIAGGKLHSKA